jgi:[acyl-carrier-protein] S-malonyltransferase
MKQKKIGMVFPGQGSQYLGMGKELYDKYRIIQEHFEEASNCLDKNFVKLCFASSEKQLRNTINSQTSIFLLSASIYSVLKEKYGITPDVVAGHGSGEYAALFAAGGMSFPDVIYLLKKRGEFMDLTTKQRPGSMIAVLGLEQKFLQKICNDYNDSKDLSNVAEIANYNGIKHFVVSGTHEAVGQVHLDARAAGGRVIKMNVAGGFHSRLMEDAAKQFAMYMIKVDFKNLNIPLIDNISGKTITKNTEFKESIKQQMGSHIKWSTTMQKFKDCDIVVEIGPSSKLSRSLKREWPEKEIMSINNTQDIEQFLLKLGKPVARRLHSVDCDKESCAKDDIIIIDNDSFLEDCEENFL